MNTSYTLQSGKFYGQLFLTGIIGFVFAFSFLLSPKQAHAESCLGNIDPKSYIENYLKKQQQDTTIDIANLATKLLGVEISEGVSLSDAIGTVYSSNKAAECFQDKEYWKGFELLGEMATRISIDKVAQAIVGYSPVTWPATVVDIGLNILRNKIDETAINNIISNYNLALGPDWCKTDINQCHQRIIECSELSISTHNPWVCFLDDGYQFYNGWLTYPTLSNQNFVNPDIDREKFYASAKTIYQEKRTAEQIVQQNEQAMAGLIDEALKIANNNPETATANNNGGFFSNLWKKIVNLFTKNDTNTELPAQIGDAVKNSYQDCPAYLFLLAEYMKTQPPISAIQSKINSLSIGNVEVTPTDNKVLISVRGDDTLALEATRQKISQALSELGLQETRMDVTGSYRAKTCVSKEDFLKRQNPLPPEKNFGGDWKADWRSTDNQSGYSDIKIYAVQQLTDSKGVEGIMLSGEGTQYFGSIITTFKVSATVIGEEITLYQYFNEIKDTVIYKGTISVDRGNGTWTNTLKSSGTWSMTRK